MPLRIARADSRKTILVRAAYHFDERLQLFRFHHLKLAQRIIGGGVIGTGGMPMEVLQQRMHHVAYRELWDLRNKITAHVDVSG